MPIYEYICSDCKLKFELLRAMSQSEESALCPGCGSNAERVLSLFSANSEGTPVSGTGSACSTCTSNTCSSCSLAG